MKEISTCPVCDGEVIITEVKCTQCKSEIRGKFHSNRFNLFSKEQLYFIEIFLKNEGNIKMVEKELGISYPTVKGKLQKISKVLGYTPEASAQAAVEAQKAKERMKLLKQLKEGTVNFDEAMKKMGELK